MIRWLLAAAFALVIAPTATAHLLAAQGAGSCSYPPCTDTHLEGHGQVGIPGVNPDFAHFDTSVDSDNGQLSIFGGFSWIEGLTKPSTPMHFDDLIEEGVFLERIAGGPVTLRATLVLEAPVVTARIQSDYFGIYMGSFFDYGYEADLRVELINATAIWDTPTFLTAAPEPTEGALASTALAALVLRSARSGHAEVAR